MNEYCPITGESQCKCLKSRHPFKAIQVDLKSAMRKLFTDHGVYTKFVIDAIVSHTTDLDVLLDRLMLNQENIGNQLKPIIGSSNAIMLTTLLKKHISLAGEVIKDAVNNDPVLKEVIDLLFENSVRVAGFLTSLNPEKLPFEVTKDMFDRHNQFIIDITIARIHGNHAAEYKKFDSYYVELLELSDMIVNAL